MIPTKKQKFLIASLKCAQKKMFIASSGQETYSVSHKAAKFAQPFAEPVRTSWTIAPWIFGIFWLKNSSMNSSSNVTAAVAASSQCEKCQTGCTTRNHSIQNCTGCSSGFFYNFSCLQDLPNRILSQRFNQPLHAPITARLAVMQPLISSAALFSPTFPVSVSQLAPPLCPIT